MDSSGSERTTPGEVLARPRQVVVTGMGLVSPLGTGLDACWRSLLAGQSGITPIQGFDPAGLPVRIAGEVTGFQPELWLGRKSIRRLEHFAQFAVGAARQAWQAAGLPPGRLNSDRAGCVLGSFLSSLKVIEENHHLHRSPHLSPFIVPRLLGSSAAGVLAQEFGLLGPNLCLTSLGSGGLQAVGLAADIIARGQADLMLAGGTESALNPLMILGLCAASLLSMNNANPQGAGRPFDVARDGLVLGEGAAVLILEEKQAAQERGAALLAQVAGFAGLHDGGPSTQASVVGQKGIGLAASQALALDRAGLDPEDIDYVVACAAGLPKEDETEARALRGCFPRHRQPLVGSPKGQIGHWLGAAGAPEAALAVMALREKKVPPQINLIQPDPDLGLNFAPAVIQESKLHHVMINAAGMAGECASLVLSRPDLTPPMTRPRGA